MEREKRGFTSPSKLKAAIVSVFMVFIGSTLLSILISMIVASSRGLDANAVASSFFDNSNATNEIMDCQIVGRGYGNFLGYFISLAAIILWMRNDFITDYNSLMENKKKSFILIPILAVSFAGIAILIDYLFGLGIPESDNQSTIVSLLISDARIPMILSTVLFAPIVEEMIYRKAIFSVMRQFNLPLAYVTSIVLFSLPHMLSSSSSVGIWFLQLVPYALCGGLLCFVYHISGYNVYASIAAHMLNNLIAVILVLSRGF